MSATPNGVRQGTAARSAAQALARAPVVRLGVRSPPTGPELHEQMAQLLHEGALEPKRWREFLEVLGRQLKGNSATLILRSPTIGETGLLYTWGGSAEVISQYARRYFATDPFVQLPDKQVITLHDFVPPGELERSPFFTDYLVPWDSIYHLGVDVRDEGRFYARLRVSRPRSAGNFSAADRAVVERLVPHFDNAIRTRATIDAARMGRAVQPGIVEALRVRRALGPGQFAVIVRPASGRLGTEEPTLSSAVAVFISAETDRAQTPPVETVRKLFDLTRKEAQLAMCLTNGRSLREAAADLDITLNTARAHLRSIFAKTGIDRQARLVRAILRSVAALG
jgi:DNA-binding CsgD family transcriptional regulator